jgi:murein endopeptidase
MAIPLSRREMDFGAPNFGMAVVDKESILPPTEDYTPFATKVQASPQNLKVDLRGLRGGPIEWTKDNHFRLKQYYRVYRWDRAKIVLVKDWFACREAGPHRTWLSKVRPWWRHDDHFHSAVRRPAASANRKRRRVRVRAVGHELDFWFKDSVRYPKPPALPPKPEVSMTLAGMQPASRQVLNAP